MSNKKETKNNLSWENLFQKYNILEQIKQEGIFEITSSQINKERESRLMVKFDHRDSLPKIFSDNNLSILPISRSQYIIGSFETHLKINYDRIFISDRTTVHLSDDITSIDYTNLYSESAVFHCAFNSQILHNFLSEEVLYFTVSGRMSTGSFYFKIKNTTTKEYYNISVENSQCEIDAGIEGDRQFFIIETKMGKVDDFLIRQLYYPYRLWSSKISKPVIPILMTYSNDIFSFFMYHFNDIYDYNSIELIDQKHYAIDFDSISRDEVYRLFEQITVRLNPKREGISLPQANKFERIIDLLSILKNQRLTHEDITSNYEFVARQTSYYTSAARYLGLLKTSKTKKKTYFLLTDEGKSIFNQKHKYKILALIEKILEQMVFYKIFKVTLENGEIPPRTELVKIMMSCNLDLKQSTIERRESTVRRWIEWIWLQIE